MTNTAKQAKNTKSIENTESTKSTKNIKSTEKAKTTKNSRKTKRNAGDLNNPSPATEQSKGDRLNQSRQQDYFFQYAVNGAIVDKQKKPCYIPLNLISQCGHERVLFYNGNAPREAIFECATVRIEAAIHLLECFYHVKTAQSETLSAVASASSLLLNDALTLLHELNPKAAKIKQ